MQFRGRVATLIYVNVGEPPAAVELTDLSQRVTADGTKLIAVLANTGKRTGPSPGHVLLY